MVKCVIFGCGQIAGGYDTPDSDFIRTHAKAFADNKECELVGVFDTDNQKAEEFAETWDVSYVADSPEKLLEKCEPDLVSICSPTNTHEELFFLSCDCNVKNIWLEKPAAININSVRKMKDTAENSQSNVWVNYYRRYDSGFRRVKEELTSLGKLNSIRAIYTKGLRHNGSHMLDLLAWLFGELKVIDIISVLDDEHFPTASVTFAANDVTIDLLGLDYHDYEMFEVDIIGALGRIRILDGGQEIVFQKVVESKYYSGYRNLMEHEVHSGSYGKFMQQGLAMGLAGSSMPGLEDELAIQENINAISRIAEIQL